VTAKLIAFVQTEGQVSITDVDSEKHVLIIIRIHKKKKTVSRTLTVFLVRMFCCIDRERSAAH
jgi:hypothetical protein